MGLILQKKKQEAESSKETSTSQQAGPEKDSGASAKERKRDKGQERSKEPGTAEEETEAHKEEDLAYLQKSAESIQETPEEADLYVRAKLYGLQRAWYETRTARSDDPAAATDPVPSPRSSFGNALLPVTGSATCRSAKNGHEEEPRHEIHTRLLRRKARCEVRSDGLMRLLRQKQAFHGR